MFKKKHDFDLENPEIVGFNSYSKVGEEYIQFKSTMFKCKKCGKTLCLDLEQMKRLPRQMAFGCIR